MWVLDHLADLEADFLVFYRIEDPFSLDGPRFFRLAWRCSAYQGSMRAVAEAEEYERQNSGRRGSRSYERPPESHTEPQNNMTNPDRIRTQEEWARETNFLDGEDYDPKTFDWKPLMQQL